MTVAAVGQPAGTDGPIEPAPALARALRGYLDHLTVERGLARNTLLSYRRDLDRYLAHLTAVGVSAVDQVTQRQVADHLAALRMGDERHPPLAAASAAR